jgi:hypothetical protein
MRVKAKVDPAYGILIGSVAAILLAAAVWAVVEAGVRFSFFVPLSAACVGFLAWLTFGSWYELRDDHLYCRSGPFVEKIPYGKIRSLRLVRNSFSSMALARDRIEIRQNGKGFVAGTTYISPEGREAFLDELKERCPNLER